MHLQRGGDDQNCRQCRNPSTGHVSKDAKACFVFYVDPKPESDMKMPSQAAQVAYNILAVARGSDLSLYAYHHIYIEDRSAFLPVSLQDSSTCTYTLPATGNFERRETIRNVVLCS
jgi:hypothetical protein